MSSISEAAQSEDQQSEYGTEPVQDAASLQWSTADPEAQYSDDVEYDYYDSEQPPDGSEDDNLELEVPYQASEVEEEQPDAVPPSTTMPTVSSYLSWRFGEALRLVEAAESETKELQQRVKQLEDEKLTFRQTINERIENLEVQLEKSIREKSCLGVTLQHERTQHSNECEGLRDELWEEKRDAMWQVTELQLELEQARTDLETSSSGKSLQAQHAVFRDRIEVLERQLDDLRLEKIGQHPLEPDETLRLQYQELEDKNRGLQEQHSKWLKLFEKFLQRAADLQRKDASKHQIKKGFKELHKIVKEGELQGL